MDWDTCLHKVTGMQRLRRVLYALVILSTLAGLCPPFIPSARAQESAPPTSPDAAPYHLFDECLTPGANRDYGKPVVVGDPIAAGSGDYQFTHTYFSFDGPLPFAFRLRYNTNTSYLVSPRLPYRFYWEPFSMGVYDQVYNGKTFTAFQLPDANWVSFKKAGAEWTLAEPTEDVGWTTFSDNGSAIPYQLQETARFFYLFDPMAERLYLYEKIANQTARIVKIMDRNQNALTYTYDPADETQVTRIDDGAGRYLTLSYTTVGGQMMLTKVQRGASFVRVLFNYEAAAPDNGGMVTLRSVSDANWDTTTYAYTTEHCPGGCITHATLDRGNVPYRQVYREIVLDGAIGTRVVSQTDAYSNTLTLTYQPAANGVTAQLPDTSRWQYEHYSAFSRPKILTDTLGHSIAIAKNASEQITGITDRFGDTTFMTYHTLSGKLASLTNAAGQTIQYTYTPQAQTLTNPLSPTEQISLTFYNLTRIDYPLPTGMAAHRYAPRPMAAEQFTYDARGNLLTYTDLGGQVWTYTYNARGQLLTATNPTGGVVTYTYNDADGTLATRTDSDAGMGITTYQYDANSKKITRVTQPDGDFMEWGYLDNHLYRLCDEKGACYYFYYDVNGNLRQVNPPTLRGDTYLGYDALERVASIADSLHTTTTLTYDALGRLAAVTDPTGMVETYGYDPRSNAARTWRTRVTRGGQSWLTEYDVEGLVAALRTPLGHTTTFERDVLGHITRLTDPLGNSTRYRYDALGRLTHVSDSLTRTTTYSYDARNLLTAVTLPDSSAAAYQYSLLGQLTRITDAIGSQWNFAYSPNGRLTALTDPLGRATTQRYDPRGRPTVTVFADSTTLTRTYDAVSNLTGLQGSGGLDITRRYDALNRLTYADFLSLTYDDVGRIVNTRDTYRDFGATYDAAGRLKTASYDNGAFVVTYTHSFTNGLLTHIQDTYGTQLAFTYDSDERWVGLTRSNGVNAAFTYDAADRLTRIQDGAVTDLQYTLDAAGQVAQLQMTAPLEPGAYPLTPLALTFDAAGQIATAGYAYDARGRQIAAPGATYTWDAASRLTGVNTTTLTYNGLGDVRTRAQGETTWHYYYNYALETQPIVAEGSSAAGQLERYYIYTPEGALLYALDASTYQPFFYHFDRVGSTLALSDASGAVTDAYAYDPYGKVLAHTGANPQPFTYVGRWGVRQESATLYQMRARYYDVDTQRFLSPDPLWPNLSDPRQINPYQYALGAPTNYIDPSGLYQKEIFNEYGKVIGYTEVPGEDPRGYAGDDLSGYEDYDLTPEESMGFVLWWTVVAQLPPEMQKWVFQHEAFMTPDDWRFLEAMILLAGVVGGDYERLEKYREEARQKNGCVPEYNTWCQLRGQREAQFKFCPLPPDAPSTLLRLSPTINW